jgi:hypothetical protein
VACRDRQEHVFQIPQDGDIQYIYRNLVGMLLGRFDNLTEQVMGMEVNGNGS